MLGYSQYWQPGDKGAYSAPELDDWTHRRTKGSITSKEIHLQGDPIRPPISRLSTVSQLLSLPIILLEGVVSCEEPAGPRCKNEIEDAADNDDE